MLQEWIKAAREDQPVWLPDVREESAGDPDAVHAVLRLALCTDGEIDFPLDIPSWKGREEERFVTEYVNACVFNTLSAYSGRKITIFLPAGSERCRALLERLPETFQLSRSRRSGYGKAVSVANRLCRTFGAEEFRFALEDMEDYIPAPALPQKAKGGLGERLREAVKRSEKGLFCGVDIGGTDIKLVLAQDGKLIDVRELDWNPAASPTAEGIITPIADMISAAVAANVPGGKLDGLGISFPDVVIRDRVVGGETPKTRGMRDNGELDYEREFSKLTGLADALAPLCRPEAPIRITNDGHIAALTAAAELAAGGRGSEVSGGVIAHSLGTDLGTGWLNADGSIPEIPLELYDFLLDLGSWPSRELEARDLRCVRNENSGLPGARRYLGQAAAFRLAQKIKPSLLDGFTVQEGETLALSEQPDLRKPCLEHLMQKAQDGDEAARDIFRQIGGHLGQVNRELDFLLHPGSHVRFLFGRFVKKPACFALLREGCAVTAPELRLEAADDTLAETALMAALARRGSAAVAQFGQAVGAVYFGLMVEDQ